MLAAKLLFHLDVSIVELTGLFRREEGGGEAGVGACVHPSNAFHGSHEAVHDFLPIGDVLIDNDIFKACC